MVATTSDGFVRNSKSSTQLPNGFQTRGRSGLSLNEGDLFPLLRYQGGYGLPHVDGRYFREEAEEIEDTTRKLSIPRFRSIDTSIPGEIRTLGSHGLVARKHGQGYVRVYLDFPLTLQLRLDRETVLTESKEVTGKPLIEPQVRKGTAGGKGARKFCTELTKPFPGWGDEIRELTPEKQLIGVSLSALFVSTESSSSLGRFLSNPVPLFLRRGCSQGISTDLCWGD